MCQPAASGADHTEAAHVIDVNSADYDENAHEVLRASREAAWYARTPWASWPSATPKSAATGLVDSPDPSRGCELVST